MKKAISVLFFALVALCSCHKTPTESTTISEGLVIGFRAEKCMCCTGNLIKIGNDTLQFEVFPSGTPKFTPVYPYPVKVEWQRDTSVCKNINSRAIILSRFERL
ncbi:MAG: hypothetical protein U5L45_14830 [Saprospiraceae bacterium]|nr:hypothetical protein [Saprospiraceae bacterium]